MSNTTKEVILTNMNSNSLQIRRWHNQSNNNYYGIIDQNGVDLFRSVEIEVYGNNVKQVDNYPTIQVLRINDNSFNKALEVIDEFMKANKQQIMDETSVSDPLYRPIVRHYTTKNGIEGCSSELLFRVNKDLSYSTVFYDDKNDQLKVKNFEELQKALGYRSKIKVKLNFEYQVKLTKNQTYEYSILPKIKFIMIIPESNDRADVDPEMLALKVSEITESDIRENTTFAPAPKEMTKLQNFVRTEWKIKPGRRIRLENIPIEKEDENVYVGLAPPPFDSNKITLVAKDSNLEFFKNLDKVFMEKTTELREILELKKKDKMEYIPILSTKDESNLSTFKLTIDLQSDKKTKFYVDGKEIEYEDINGLRKYLGLGSVMKNPNIIISKLFYHKIKSCLAVKLKLKSCTVIPGNTSSKSDYVANGKFYEEDIDNDVEVDQHVVSEDLV